jgi:hypothetical protein
MPTRNIRAACAFLAVFSLPLLLCLATAQADVVTVPAVNILVGPEGSPMSVDQEDLIANSASMVDNPDGSVSFINGSMATANWVWEWDFLTVKVDPFISSSFGFQNISGSTMTFVVSVSLPVAPMGPSTLIGGSMGGSVTDSNFNGAGGVSTVAPTALYTGMIDGVGVIPTAELHPHPYSSDPFLFPGDTRNILAVNFGLPGPSAPGPAVLGSIGIMNKFSLSSMDSVSMTNFFIVEQVPEPSSIVMALTCLAALGWHITRIRKRR